MIDQTTFTFRYRCGHTEVKTLSYEDWRHKDELAAQTLRERCGACCQPQGEEHERHVD